MRRGRVYNNNARGEYRSFYRANAVYHQNGLAGSRKNFAASAHAGRQRRRRERYQLVADEISVFPSVTSQNL